MWLLFDRQLIPFRSEALPVEQHVFNYQGQTLPVSTPERAFMECLLLAPKYYNYLDLYMLMEQLRGLCPMVVQQLLEQVSSYRAKRMFIYLRDEACDEFTCVLKQKSSVFTCVLKQLFNKMFA